MSASTLTTAQRSAIFTHDRPLIVTAGAGSGKTFVLVNRFLALLDADSSLPLNAIAAITFTEKAAAEMRERVRDTIMERARDARSRASVWRSRLDAIDGARIGTIHSLCAGILRANAADAQIDPAFEVLDDIGARMLLDTAIDDALRTPGAAAESASALLDAYDGGQVRAALRSLVTSEAPNSADAAALFESWRHAWDATAQAELTQLDSAIAGSAFAHWSDAIAPDSDKLGAIWRGVVAGIASWREQGDAPFADQIVTLTAVEQTIKMNVGAAGSWGGKDALAQAKDALRTVKAHLKDATEAIGAPPGVLDESAARLIVHWSRLTDHSARRYAELKSARHALDFDDLERCAADLLDRESVRDRVRAEIRYVLVDEFQDTNARQYRIARALTDGGHPGALFVVGDPKQSIYGFRGADVRVFKEVAGGIIARGGEGAALSESFRTHTRLVGMFNRFFAHLLTETSTYAVDFGESMDARRDAPTDAPPIELLLIARPSASEKADQRARSSEADSDDAPETRTREADSIAARLVALVRQSRPVYDKASKAIRPVQYGDMAILFQAMSHAPLYEDALARAGVPYVTVAGKGFYDRQEIWDALNLLRALYNPADDLALVSALRSPLFALSDEALLRLRLSHPDGRGGAGDGRVVMRPYKDGDRGGVFWTALFAVDLAGFDPDDADAIRFARVTLDDLGALAGRVSIADLLRQAYADSGYLAILSALPGGVRLRANAEKLIAIADAGRQIALGEFITALDTLKAQEAREGEAALDALGVVRLMTVHKSKGLEFPVVVLADSSYKGGGRGGDAAAAYDTDSGWTARVYDPDEAKYVDGFASRAAKTRALAKNDAEKRRLLYVAATRAADLLIASGTVWWNKEGGMKTAGWLAWLSEALSLEALTPDDPAFAVGRIDTPIGRVGMSLAGTHDAASDDAVPDEPIDRFDAAFADFAALTDEQSEANPVAAPPLMGALAHTRIDARTARDLSATQLADLGAALGALPETHRPYYRERWRRGVGQRAPESIPTVSESQTRAHARLVGEIVHRALQYGLEEEKCDLRRLLADYAWESGVIDPAESRGMVDEAYTLLKTAQASEVFRWIAASDRAGLRVFRELPFTYQTAHPDGSVGRRIHGVLDMLIERDDGSWAVVDFKTARVRGNVGTHAARYTLQVGAYAAAVESLVGVTPRAWLYYIHHDALIEVAASTWRAGLESLEGAIGALFEG